MIRPILLDWCKKYVPILINSICTALCIAFAGCKLTADNLSVEIEYPASYNSTTNTISR